ncbi:MAG: hypothetical protein IJ106_07300 [Parasporobacterium sp.]|nr:hypothetical protein [Parasporobacterium sp.]
MNDFEKIEKIRQHADVTFEEAKEALEASGGDLLDAMIYLEQQGKAKAPSQSVHSTKYEEQTAYSDVEETIKRTTAKQENEGGFKNTLKRIWRFFTRNYFVVSRSGDELLVMPLLVAVIIILCFFYVSIIALIVLLFFGFRYSFRGKNNMDSVNETMDKAAGAASQFADKMKDEINKNR